MGSLILVFPFVISIFMLLARVGTTPRTAYSASLTLGLTSVQKKLFFLAQNEEDILTSLCIICKNQFIWNTFQTTVVTIKIDSGLRKYLNGVYKGLSEL